VIANGELAGMTLREAITVHHAAIMGDTPLSTEGGFPLLLKYLDACDNLSVQVHPSPAYAAAHAQARLKDEAWVILDAQPGAKLYLGLQTDVSQQQLLDALAAGKVDDVLNVIEPTPGSCYTIPSGTVHALGKGIMLAEVQTPSDTTFRLYDWGRENTSKRTMHLDEALRCIDFANIQPLPAPMHLDRANITEVDGVRTTRLSLTDHFAIERLDVLTTSTIEVVTSGIPEVWMVLCGQGQIVPSDQPILQMHAGRTILMPAGLMRTDALLEPGLSLLRVTLPSPLKGKIA